MLSLWLLWLVLWWWLLWLCCGCGLWIVGRCCRRCCRSRRCVLVVVVVVVVVVVLLLCCRCCCVFGVCMVACCVFCVRPPMRQQPPKFHEKNLPSLPSQRSESTMEFWAGEEKTAKCWAPPRGAPLFSKYWVRRVRGLNLRGGLWNGRRRQEDRGAGTAVGEQHSKNSMKALESCHLVKDTAGATHALSCGVPDRECIELKYLQEALDMIEEFQRRGTRRGSSRQQTEITLVERQPGQGMG